MTDIAELARKLQIKPGSRVWVWPDGAGDAEPLLAEADITRSEVDGAEVALLYVADRTAVDIVMTERADELARVRVVWIVYAKGNRTDMNRDTLWVQLAGFGWRAVSQVSYSDTLSALRVRALKEGEPAPV